MAEKFRIEALSATHERTRFTSGSLPLDRYFQEQASQDSKRRIASCFVAVSVETRDIIGFYTLSAASIPLSALTADIAKKLPRYPVIPAALMGRLAITKSRQGKGLGGVLLADAVLRTARVELGVFAMLVDAKDDDAQRFYEHFGFRLLPDIERRLCLPIAIGLRQFAGQPGSPM